MGNNIQRFIFGGRNENDTMQYNILKWDPNNADEFIIIDAKLPQATICDSQHVVYHGHSHQIYGIGSYIFNPMTDSFEPSNIASMPIIVRSNCIVIDNINDLMYVIGGFNENEIATNNLQILKLKTYQWELQTDDGELLEKLPVNIAACSCWLAIDCDKIYTFGGTDGGKLLDTIYRFVLYLYLYV